MRRGGGRRGEGEQICPCTKCSHVHVVSTCLSFSYLRSAVAASLDIKKFHGNDTPTHNKMFIQRSLDSNFDIFLLLLFCTATCEIFYQTPAGYTADRKTRRKRNMGCYELLSVSCHPSPPLQLPPSPHRASVAPPAATLSGLTGGGRPPPSPTPP